MFNNTCKCFQNLCLKHNCIHTCSIRTQPANINNRVCLGFKHSYMKKFLSLFKFKWLKPLNRQHLPVLKTKNPNPISNPNTPNCTICLKHCHKLCLKSYLKQFNEKQEVCTPAFPQTNQFIVHLLIIEESHRAFWRTFNSMTFNWANGPDNCHKFGLLW